MSSVLGTFLERSASEALGFAVGTALANSLNPEAIRLSQEAYNIDPTRAIEAELLAQGVAQGQIPHDWAQNEARNSGIDSERFARMVDIANVGPGIGEAFELWRRGLIDEAGFRRGLKRAGIEDEWIGAMVGLRDLLLSPADLANAYQQQFITQEAMIREGGQQGVSAERMNVLFELAGLPPGIGEGLELLRRGEITEERFRQYVHEGHTKTKYEDDLLKLRYQPLSASVAAEALIRQRIPEGQAVQIAEQNGIKRDDFLLWSNMLGRPIATGQALQLARRGEFTFAQFKEAVARSDVRTEYADDLWKLRRVLPNLFQLRALLSSGAITEAKGVEIATDLGYDHEIAAGIVAASKKAKTQHTRDLAATQIDALFESGLETREWAVKALQALGYDPDEAEWHLELLEARRLLAALQSDLGAIHRTYVGHEIDKNTAIAELDSLQMRAEARDLLLEIWDNERQANVVLLTNAEIGQAFRYFVIDEATAIAKWMEHGYSQADAQIKADIVRKRARTTPPAS